MKKPIMRNNHPLWRRYTNIRAALYNPNCAEHRAVVKYKLTCEWDTFKSFAADIEAYLGLPPTRRHKLNRIDQTRGWHINNLRWAIQRDVARSTVRVRKYRYRNQTRCATEWSELLKISYWSLIRRLNQGMTVAQVVRQFKSQGMKNV